jgi:hypothetical protein
MLAIDDVHSLREGCRFLDVRHGYWRMAGIA